MNILGNVWQAIGRVFDLIEEMCGALIDGLESQQPAVDDMFPMMSDVLREEARAQAHKQTEEMLRSPMFYEPDPIVDMLIPGNGPLNGIIGTTIDGRNTIETNTLF